VDNVTGTKDTDLKEKINKWKDISETELSDEEPEEEDREE